MIKAGNHEIAQITPRVRGSPDPPGDRGGVGQIYRGAKRRQALGGHRPAEPLAAPAGPRDPPGRDRPEEYHHDRPHRGGQDRDRPEIGQAHRLAVPQDRGLQIHRGGLCGPGRGIHGPGPDGAGRRPGQGRRTGQGPGQGRSRGGRAAAGFAAPGLDPGDAR